jgi:hypothetical protein
MGKHVGEGKKGLLHTNKDGSRVFKEQFENDGQPGVQTDEDTEDLSASFGRTIALGNYEFGRVGMGIKVSLPYPVHPHHRENAYKRIRDAINEILDREEAFLRGEERKYEPIDLNGVGVKLVVWLDYGLTFKKKGMDSNKVDVSASRRIHDGGDIEKTIAELEEEVGKRIGDYKAMVLGTEGSDVGF